MAGSGVTSAPPSVVLRDWQADGTNGSFRFATTTNLDYTLFRSTNLTSDPWTPFQSGVAQSVNGFATVTVPVPAQGGAFYKLGSASSAPVLFNLSRGGTSFEFQFVGALGPTYNVQRKRTLNQNRTLDAEWQTLFTVSGSGGLLTVTDSNAVASSGYYRLQY